MSSDLQQWLDDRGYASVDQLRGSMSHAKTARPDVYERANYVKVLHSWSGSTDPAAYP
jgi:dihydroorotate dehydrogenase (fumarate)